MRSWFLCRVFEEQLIVTFKDSKSALFALQLDGLQVCSLKISFVQLLFTVRR